MRQIGSLVWVLTLVGCGNASQDSLNGRPQGAAGAPALDAAPPISTDASAGGPPTELVSGPGSIVGLTSDGWVVFRDAESLRAAKLDALGEIQTLSDRPGSVLVRGKVVFNWADVDWTANVGDLSVWSAAGGVHVIGPTLYAEGLVAASDSGEAVVYVANTTASSNDLMIAPGDFSTSQMLVESMGRGSDVTCSPSIGFVGERLFVGACAVGARSGKIERFERLANGWESTVIATRALPTWSADASGERVHFQSESYSGQYAENEVPHLIDASVSSGFMLPDGSAVLYTVGDQLRRTALPDINPIPIVTTGFAQRAEFSPAFDLVLYSTEVTYDDGTKRDLRLTRTDAFNPAPVAIVADPVAGLARSCMTADGKFVLYLTDMSPTGATLHVSSVDGTERAVLPGVIDVVRAHDSVIVFTDNSSDPNLYPVVADLKALDLAGDGPPRLIEAKVVDGRAFHVAASGTEVIYVRSGIDRDEAAGESGGIFLQTLP